MLAMNESYITINTYHEYMWEAFDSLQLGLQKLADSKNREEDDQETNWLAVSAGMYCRYAFLLAANALEAAANALILGMETSQASYSDLEKLPTLLKFEVFCLAKGKYLDRGNAMYARIKDVVRCRNEFVHPKPKKASFKLSDDGKEVEFQVPRTGTREHPTYYSIFEPSHACEAIGDILAFISWVVFDICAYEQKEGVLLIGCESYGSTGSITQVGSEYGFDLRSFNEN